MYTKEKYLDLNSFENRRAICNLRTSTFKLETETHFFFDCEKYNDLRNEMIKTIKNTEKIDLQKENKIEKLTFLFSNGKLQSLNTIGKFIKEAFELRTKNE